MARVSQPPGLNRGNDQGESAGGPDRGGTIASKLRDPRDLAADRTDLDERLMQFGHPLPRIASLPFGLRNKLYRLRHRRQVSRPRDYDRCMTLAHHHLDWPFGVC